MRNQINIILLCCGVVIAQKDQGAYMDGDKWIWGIVDGDKTEDRSNEKLISTTEAPYDPCNFYNPDKPSFNSPMKSISQQKCDEYIWDFNTTLEQGKRAHECFEKMFAGKPRPPAAVGGRPTYLGEFPHMGAIGWKAVPDGYAFKCGSSLISSKFILTAAHCASASELDTTLADTVPKIVRLNDKNLFHTNEGGILLSHDVNITSIIVHPNYNPPKKYYDIALMELEHEVTFTRYLRPACLWNKFDLSGLGKDATLTGWGVLTQGSYVISPELQAANVDLIPSDQCDLLLKSSRNRNWVGVMDSQLCAGKLAGGVDACQGDSGGPLQIVRKDITRFKMYYVIGVTSFGIGCAQPNRPGIYTRVSSFISWIESVVWSKGV